MNDRVNPVVIGPDKIKFTGNINSLIMITIIAATDFSPEAENAVQYAASIAKQFNARLILFNAYALPIHAANTILPATSIQEMLEENIHLLKVKAELLSVTHDIQVGYESTYSFVEDELKGLVTKYDAKLLVLGMAKKTLEQDLIGNTTTSAIKKMKFPVLAVPLGAKFEGIKKVLFACDVLEGVPEQILSQIKEIAMGYQSEVEVFYVDQKVDELKTSGQGLVSLDVISDGLDGVTYTHKNVKSNAVIKEIEKEIIAYKAELLIMIPKEYGFWASLVHKSKTRMMASGLDIPLLSIPV